MSPKIGRPTDNPKTHKLSMRLDDKCKEILDKYCEQEKVAQTDAVRQAIMLLEKHLKQK